jgi:hypothetical protein
VSPSFDNRKGLIRDRVTFILTRNKWQQRNVASHFLFRANGRQVAYCYIRKNACSAFKRLICEISGHAKERAGSATDLDFLFRYHEARTLAAVEACDERIFIYRDPLQRAVSTFVDKFVTRNGNRDIFVSFADLTGIRPDDATFDFFVKEYLSRPPVTVDAHCVGQYHHLLPILYTKAMPIGSLFSCMRKLIGDDLARRFFLEKTNAVVGRRSDSPCHDIPAGMLHQRFETTGQVPSVSALLTEQTVRILRKVYQDDLILLGKLSSPEEEPGAGALARENELA